MGIELEINLASHEKSVKKMKEEKKLKLNPNIWYRQGSSFQQARRACRCWSAVLALRCVDFWWVIGEGR